jgi:cytochrome P450
VPTTKDPPGPRGNLFLGHLVPYLSDPLGFLTRCARRYGDVVRLRLPGMAPIYLLSHPDHIEQVLRNNHRGFRKDQMTRDLTSLIGQGLLTSEGDYWRQQRQLAQPAFQGKLIQSYGPVMVDLTLRLLEQWQPGQVRLLSRDLARLTLGIIGRALFNEDMTTNAPIIETALRHIMDWFLSPFSMPGVPTWLPWPGLGRYREAIKKLDRIVFGMIQKHRQGPQGNDLLLSRLLGFREARGKALTDPQVRDEVLTVLLAGHETTALALAYTFHLLARHPEVDARVAAEVEEVLEDRLPTVEDIPRLRYTEWVIRESMRVYPPVWIIGREAITDCEIAGYHLPKGTQLWMMQWIVHRDPRWYDEPEVFRPERWGCDWSGTDLIHRLPRGAYFPFGDGPRICIGNFFALQEAILILATVVQRFWLVPASTRPLRLVPAITLRVRGGVRLVVQSRLAGRSTRKVVHDGHLVRY